MCGPPAADDASDGIWTTYTSLDGGELFDYRAHLVAKDDGNTWSTRMLPSVPSAVYAVAFKP